MSGDVFNYGERWEPIQEFPRYQVSTEGRIFNTASGKYMRWSQNNFGHAKISLLDDRGNRYTRSVGFLVARAFVEPPNELCDRIIYLNGDLSDVRSENLAWRPRWFCWKYSRQFKTQQPTYYQNLHVLNISTGDEYESIMEAAMTEGLLVDQIWRSTYSGAPVFPTGSVWGVRERV